MSILSRRPAIHLVPLLLALGAAAAGLPATAFAELDTQPYRFVEPPAGASGRFEWDEFSGSAGGPHVPDAGIAGTGHVELGLQFVPLPMQGPPQGLITSTQNIYAGGTLAHATLQLRDLAAAEPWTTVVLQIATQEPLDSQAFLLGAGLAPAEFVDRGVGLARHDANGQQAAAPTQYYWALWQVPADESLDLHFSSSQPHVSLAALRVDYFNSASPLDIAPPAPVPEPASQSLALAAAIIGLGAIRRRAHGR